MSTFILFILILSLLIFVHEFGHFIVAKKSGIKVEEFGFGLPPRIIGKKIGETIYSINWLPIGGFVRLLGENGATEIGKETKGDQQRAFCRKSILIRIMVLIAGVTMNLALGIAAFSLLYARLGIPTKSGQVTVVEVSTGSPAETAGLRKDEIIFQINQNVIVSSQDFIERTKLLVGTEVQLLVGDSQSARVITITPRSEPPTGEGALGVVISDTVMKKYPWYQMPPLVLREGLREALSWSGNILTALKSTVVGMVTEGKAPSDIAGPIGIFKITGQAAEAGWLAVVQFVGILSINLAIVNILPFPALDGGRVMFLGYEAVTRRKVNPNVESVVNSVGMAILILLLAVITVGDILKIVQ